MEPGRAPRRRGRRPARRAARRSGTDRGPPADRAARPCPEQPPARRDRAVRGRPARHAPIGHAARRRSAGREGVRAADASGRTRTACGGDATSDRLRSGRPAEPDRTEPLRGEPDRLGQFRQSGDGGTCRAARTGGQRADAGVAQAARAGRGRPTGVTGRARRRRGRLRHHGHLRATRFQDLVVHERRPGRESQSAPGRRLGRARIRRAREQHRAPASRSRRSTMRSDHSGSRASRSSSSPRSSTVT